MGKMCALSTCSNEAEKQITGQIGQMRIAIDVCRDCAKGVIIGTLKSSVAGEKLRTFRVIKDGCPVCAFADECQHEKNDKGFWVWKK